MASLDYETIRPVVSHGSPALLKLGFNIDEDHPEYSLHRERLLGYYLEHIADRSRPFEGILPLLTELTQRNITWGVVTNKPTFLTNPLMKALNLYNLAATIVSGDTLKERKPDPAPMFHAANEAGVDSSNCLYIGDAARDIEAGKRAGMYTATALFGYIESDQNPNDWQADVMINSPLEILNWIDNHHQQSRVG